jgi:hypothetical protein
MENFRAIDLHQTRDFSRKMNATFEFIRQNFKPLSKSILFIAGPPVLVASVLIGSFMGDFMSLTSLSPGNADRMMDYVLSVSFWIQMSLMFVFFLVSSVMTIATINNYIILYSEKQSNQIEVQEVWERVRATFWMYLGTLFLFGLLAMGVYIILIIPFALMVAVSPFLIFFGVVFLFCAVFYLAISVSLTFFIRAYEKKGFFEAIGRSFKLVQGKWWSTFGLLIILYMIMGTVSYIFIMPWYVMMIVGTLHDTGQNAFQDPSFPMQIITTVSFTLYYLAQMVLNTLPNVGIAFQYFNLVELKEAKGLMGQIENLGQPQQPMSSQEEHY